MNIFNEIPYQRDAKGGFILGIVFALTFYLAVPLLGDEYKDMLPVTFILLIIDSFYAILGLIKYLTKANKPKNIVVDVLLNYFYLWRRSI